MSNQKGTRLGFEPGWRRGTDRTWRVEAGRRGKEGDEGREGPSHAGEMESLLSQGMGGGWCGSILSSSGGSHHCIHIHPNTRTNACFCKLWESEAH